ncbi:SMI1/KNR4 family protein [Chitinophaga cymbidii]|uniref:Knr4/Smi1-like domain-containing protein n=1 Tax=Chitinophaga cymbidii TaxID=1096750 RepID=A0A512RL73_9BACT|nr:SMI1/KNR4 family protein [Chitinophaga cymbidii]GEP96458.1 hypothetical protein CCY01nite_27180 [Chitinophaga cymbidii]
MTALETLKSILPEVYISEDEDEYQIELKPGLTDQQIETLARQFPTGRIPDDIRELLKFSAGFEFFGLDGITFDGIGQFGFETIFPVSIQLAGDGYGNFWVLDIDKNGTWGRVFYVCHDPAVVVRHSDNLAQFIGHIHEFGKRGSNSHLDIIHENNVIKVWRKDTCLIDIETARQSADIVLKNFAQSLPDGFVVADLRNKPNGSGFSWGKPGMNVDKTVKHATELIWGIEKPYKKGLFSRLFRWK